MLPALTQQLESSASMQQVGGPIFGMFSGIKIIESPLAFRLERIRKYPKRKAKSLSHWRRMNKKWLKRYGNKQIPEMYMMRDPITREQVVIAHPIKAQELWRAVREQNKQ